MAFGTARCRDRAGWLGREDSNLGIAVDMLDNARALPTCSRRSSQACCDAITKVPDLMENSVPARPVYVQRGKTHIGTCDGRTQHRILIALDELLGMCLRSAAQHRYPTVRSNLRPEGLERWPAITSPN